MDHWTATSRVTLTQDVMNVPELGRSFALKSAVHFTRIVDGSDEHGLIGRVKTAEQLTELAAEHFGASVILGEVGYECEEGFVGAPLDGAPWIEAAVAVLAGMAP